MVQEKRLDKVGYGKGVVWNVDALLFGMAQESYENKGLAEYYFD